jgi:methionyl-tRNA formyltransferase
MFLADSSALQRMPVERVLEERSVRAFHVPTLNGAATLHCLAEISPDLLLLGGVGLVSSELIRRVANRVLNAHPAVLPQYRGSYVVRWALLRGDPLAVTVHLVDAGIDTGAVLSVTRCNTPQTGSLLQIEHHMQQRQASLLVQEAAGFLSGKLQPVPQAADALHPPYSVMPPMQLLQVYQMLRRGNLRRGV